MGLWGSRVWDLAVGKCVQGVAMGYCTIIVSYTCEGDNLLFPPRFFHAVMIFLRTFPEYWNISMFQSHIAMLHSRGKIFFRIFQEFYILYLSKRF